MISIHCTIYWHLFSNFSPIHLPVKEKEKQSRIKGLILAQWINLNRINRFVVASASISCIVRKNWSYLPTTIGSYGRLAGWQTKYGRVSNFLKSIQVKLFRSLFCLNQCNAIIVSQVHFSRLLSIKHILRCVLKCKKSIFSFQFLLLNTSILNDI